MTKVTYTTVKKCFFRGRLWTPGETLEFSADEIAEKKVPKHFLRGVVPAEVDGGEAKGTSTLRELQIEEARKILQEAGELPKEPKSETPQAPPADNSGSPAAPEQPATSQPSGPQPGIQPGEDEPNMFQ